MSEEKPGHPDSTKFGQIHKRRQAEKKVRCIEVAEWGDKGKPLLLNAYPLTVNDVIALDNVYQSNAEQNVMQIIRQCLDSKGDAYFSLLDKPALLNEPSDLIGTILVQLNGESSTFSEELKKNKG